MGKRISLVMTSFVLALGIFNFSGTSVSAASNTNTVNMPTGYGSLTSNAWRSSLTISGNTYQFQYQTSAIYNGTKSVDWIRTSWEACASLRNSASMSIGIQANGVSASSSSTWQNVCQGTYWQNSNGAKGAYSERRNAVIKPSADYRSGTVSIQNEAKVKVVGDARSWSVNASV